LLLYIISVVQGSIFFFKIYQDNFAYLICFIFEDASLLIPSLLSSRKLPQICICDKDLVPVCFPQAVASYGMGHGPCQLAETYGGSVIILMKNIKKKKAAHRREGDKS